MSPDKKFGNKKSDGSFNGMIGELVKHNADMGMSTYHSHRGRTRHYTKKN